MATATRHREISERLLDQAGREFEGGDPLQAAEKAWGAFAHCVNGIAKEAGWKPGSHRRLIENAERLIDLSTSVERRGRLLSLLSAVHVLHANFYEEWQTERLVSQGLADTRELVDALRRLAAAGSTG